MAKLMIGKIMFKLTTTKVVTENNHDLTNYLQLTISK
jgi:hypothetical protein